MPKSPWEGIQEKKLIAKLAAKPETKDLCSSFVFITRVIILPKYEQKIFFHLALIDTNTIIIHAGG